MRRAAALSPCVPLVATGATRLYAVKSKEDYNRMKAQRIESFRWQDHNHWKPHRKYGADPTSWNRAEKLGSRPKTTSDKLAEAVDENPTASAAIGAATDVELGHTIKGEAAALCYDLDTFNEEQFQARVVSPLRSLFRDGDDAINAIDVIHQTTVALRNPYTASVLRDVTLTEMQSQIPIQFRLAVEGLDRVSDDVVVGWLNGSNDLANAVALSEVVNDLRLSAALLGRAVPKQVRSLVDRLCNHLMTHVSTRYTEHSAAATRVLGNIVLSHQRHADVIALAKQLSRNSITIADVTIENFASASQLPNVEPHQTWIFAAVEGACSYWLRRAKRLDAEYVWGNIEIGVTTPVPAPVARYLCAAVRHVTTAVTVVDVRADRLSTTLLGLLELTPNSMLPCRQILLLLHALLSRDIPSSTVTRWMAVLSRFASHWSKLGVEDVVRCVAVLTCDSVRVAAAETPVCKASVTTTLHAAARSFSVADVPPQERVNMTCQLGFSYSGGVPDGLFTTLLKAAAVDGGARGDTLKAQAFALMSLRARVNHVDATGSFAADQRLKAFVLSAFNVKTVSDVPMQLLRDYCDVQDVDFDTLQSSIEATVQVLGVDDGKR